MTGDHLFQTLQILNKSELTSFSRFLQSPYFNHSRPCIELYNIIRKNLKKKNWSWTEKTSRDCYSEVFSDAVFDQTRWTNIIYILTQLLYKFLALEAVQDRPLDLLRYRTENLINRWDRRVAARALDKLHATVSQHLLSEANCDLAWRATEMELLLHTSISQEKRAELDRLLASLNDQIYLVRCLRLAIEQTSRARRLHPKQIPPDFLPGHTQKAIEAYTQPKKELPLALPVIKSYFLLLKAIQTWDLTTYFDSYLGYLQEVINQLDDDVVCEQLVHATSYCGVHGRSQTQPYVDYLLRIATLFERRLPLRSATVFPATLFNNLLLPCLRHNQTDLYHSIRRQTVDLLSEEVRIDLINLMDSYFFFFTGRYQECLLCLREPEKLAKGFVVAQLSLAIRASLILERLHPDAVDFLADLQKLRTILNDTRRKYLPETQRKALQFAAKMMLKIYHLQNTSDTSDRLKKWGSISTQLKSHDGFLNAWLLEEAKKYYSNQSGSH